MKSNTKKIVIVLILGLTFPIILNYNVNFSVEQTNVNNPKTSSVYNGGIMIDAFATTNTSYSGNWSWAVSQPWCYDDNGVYVIEDLTINASTSPTGSGIYIVDSENEYFIIRNCTVYDSVSGLDYAGIKLDNTNNGLLTTNNCSNNNAGGIILFNECDNNSLSGNTANDNSVGIYLYEGSNITISGNTANDNIDGIYIEISNDNNISGNTANGNSQNGIYSYFCDYNNITGNTANDNINYGIYLDDDSDNNIISGNTVNENDEGIYLGHCIYNTISGNTIDGNEVGIFIYTALNNTIIGNTISNTDVFGIYFDEDSDYQEIIENFIYDNTIGIYITNLNDNNLVYKNFFLNNGQHALDDGTDNKWNSTTIGNYWDNHTSPDTSPPDGIVDDPYTHIGGPAGAIDYLPIAEDGAPSIEINSPAPGGVFYSTAPSFNVIITDDYLDKMWYTIDEGLNNYTFTNNGTIDQSAWDALSIGSITVTFYANDTLGHEASEDVIITKSIPSGEPDSTVVIVIIVVSIVGGVAVIAAAYLFLKKRKA